MEKREQCLLTAASSSGFTRLWIDGPQFLVSLVAEGHPQPFPSDVRVNPESQVDGHRSAGKDVVRLVPHDTATPPLLEEESEAFSACQGGPDPKLLSV